MHSIIFIDLSAWAFGLGVNNVFGNGGFNEVPRERLLCGGRLHVSRNWSSLSPPDMVTKKTLPL
jgi:hypothetical protein